MASIKELLGRSLTAHVSQLDAQHFADIAITAHQSALATAHDICGTHDVLSEGMTAAVDVVKFLSKR